MAQFSGTVKIGDLNDYIAPSQACVVSLQGQAPDAKPPAQLLEEEGKVQLHAPRSAAPGGFKQTYTPGGGADGPVKVSLNDCLACSGCVTSAETVLLQNQSVGELAAKLTEPGAVVVVSVSPQSRASLAALHGLASSDVQPRLTTALRRIGVAAVLDIGVAREMALAEASEEFMQRYLHSRGAFPAPPCPPGAPAPPPPGPLPMLASACPGWVCYAEKTQAGSLLPHISTAKSPQAVMGTLVKRRLAALQGWDPARVYHTTVMPCYDKKLEASRSDFNVPGTSIPEVDCCLTTGELQQLLEGFDAAALAEVTPTALDTLLPPGDLGHRGGAAGKQQHTAAAANGIGNSSGTCSGGESVECGDWEARFAVLNRAEPPLHGARGGSGGYLEHVLRAAAPRLLGTVAAAASLPPVGAPLPLQVVRNADLKEITIEAPGGGGAGSRGVRPLRFAAVYGFRNIQSLMRKMKLGRCEYDYVEVMACPGGCLNGGGQAKPKPGQSAAALLEELETLYFEQQEGARWCGEGGGCGRGDCCQQQQQQGVERAMEIDASAPAGSDGDASTSRAAAPPEAAGPGAAPGAVPGADECGAALVAGGWRPPLSASARALYRDWVGGAPGSPAALELLHTAYHHREKTAMGTVGDW